MKLDRVIAVRTNKTTYRDGDRCIKVFGEAYAKSDVLNEALNQARIEQTGLHIPKILEVTVIEGKWVIVYEFIEGKTLAQLMEENPDKREEYMELFVDIHMNVHGKTCPLLNKQKDSMSRHIESSEFEATVRYDLYTRLEGMPKYNQVCHGDFNPTNIIITEDGTPYIIDWAHASRGNAAADVAQTYLLFRMSGDADAAELYLDTFCRKSGIDKLYIQKWMPLVAAASSSAANSKTRAFLRNWVDGDEYR